jgi:hypothetical protein
MIGIESTSDATQSHTEVASDASQRPTRARRSGVNRKLRSPRVVENSEYVGFVRRAVAALGRRVAGGDVEGLADLARLSAAVDAALTQAVVGLRDEGYSWAEIGSRLDISRQAAQQRWGKAECTSEKERG